MNLTSSKEILNAGGMETGMKTSMRDLLLEHLSLYQTPACKYYK